MATDKIVDARKALYNHLMESNNDFRREVHAFAKDWQYDNRKFLKSKVSLKEKIDTWSEYVHTGVLDKIIEKYI